ncbi:MAG: hypothetical protein JST38_12375, partial [Bacteroidetes bacterium]|nr:hypothetical protein [Bacteroidota bacterium]
MGNIDIGGIPGQAGLVQADATGAGMDAGTVDIRGNQLFTYGCVVPGGVCAITDAYGVIDVNAYGAGGDGGMITINVAGDLFHAGVLRARSPQGNGGLIEINAGNSAEVHNLISAEGGVNGGIINLTAPSILLHRGQMPWLGGSGILYSKAVLDVVGSTDGGSVYLTAGTQLNVVDLGDVAVNQSVIDAAGLNGNGGLIYVYGPTINIGDTRFANASGSTDGGSIMLYGDITLNGWLEADGARYYGNTIGDGGYISLRGPNINIASSAHLTANGGATYGYGPSQTSNGGYIIISGDTVDVSGEFHARGASGGGGITDRGSQLLRVEASTQVDADSWYIIGGDVWVTTNAGSASHTAGAVVVDAALSTALGLGTQVSVLARTTSGGTGTLNFVDDPVITNAGGDAALQFEGPYGIFGDGLSIATTSGQTELAFHGGYGGVHLDNFSIDTSGGGIVITAYEEIELANGSIRTDGGQVILDATYSTYGILVDNSSVVTAGGGIEIRADGAVPALGRSIEIRDSQLDSDGGGIRMASGAAMGLGITINNSSVESDGGRITLYASDSGYGIYVFGSSLLDSDSGDLVLVADNSADISIVGSTINAGTVAVQADNGLGISLTDSTITSNGDIALHAGNSVTGVQINYLTHISSAIGDIDIYGTTTTGAKGVQVYYSSITSTSGDISITGSGVSWGVDLWYADITTTTGAILANGISNGANGNGVRVLHSDLSTTGGAIFLSGSSTGATSRGVRVWYSDLASGGGDIVVQGDGTLQGVTLFHADLSSDGGAIQMTGTGGWYGLTVSTSNLLSDGGDILLSGSGDDSGVGLQLNTMVSSNGGDIDIVGHGGQSIYSAGPNTVFGGVAIWNDSQVTSAGGDIYVLGTGANAGSFGVYLNDSGTALSSGGGVLTVAGDAAGTGLLLNADTSIDGGAGVVVLRAGND